MLIVQGIHFPDLYIRDEARIASQGFWRLELVCVLVYLSVYVFQTVLEWDLKRYGGFFITKSHFHVSEYSSYIKFIPLFPSDSFEQFGLEYISFPSFTEDTA